MRRLLLAGGFAIFVVVALAAHIPATYLSRLCAESTRCRISGPEGTIWDGGATLHIHDGKRWLSVPRLHWVVSMGGTLRLTTGNTVFLWAPGRVGWKMTIENLGIDATIVGALLPQPLPRTGWEGIVAIPNLQWACDWQGPDCEGTGRILWLRAGQSSLSSALGDYQADASATRGRTGIGLTLKGDGGGLGITGNGHLQRSGYSFGGEAWASGPDKERIETLLNSFGQRTGNDRYRLQLSQRFH